MLPTLKKVNALLTSRERRDIGLLLLLLLVTAAIEVVGVASVMPFVALLSKEDAIDTVPFLSSIYSALGFENRNYFLAALGATLFVLFVSSLALKAISALAILRFSSMRAHSLACRLLEKYLNRPYVFFLERNSSELSKTLLSEVAEVINGILIPVLRLSSGGIVALAMVVFLLSIQPLMTLAVFGVIGGGFAGAYALTRHYLLRTGNERVLSNKERFVSATESLNGIKELKLSGREATYLKRFSVASKRFSRLEAISRAIGDLPVYAVQAVAFGGVLGIVVYVNLAGESLQQLLPLLAMYGFAGYRLLPAVQLIFKGFTQLRFYSAALDKVHADMTGFSEPPPAHPSAAAHPSTHPPFSMGNLALSNVSYAFPNANRKAVNAVSLTIRAGDCVAFVGSTGAGKSTTVDLILGLLEPTDGTILLDGDPLQGARLTQWQRNIGYVPQSIYLSDASVSENIAFGVPREEIDMEAVIRAAKAAHIHDFITSQLAESYQTIIGERGIRLSGGQRQRLGIARALYHDPAVIVFDEATSALDNATEAAVMEAVNELTGSKTIIMIAHRLSTVERCDRIFLLSHGRLAAQGSYRELLASSSEFADMVRISHTDASNAGSPSPSNPQPLEAS